MNKPIVHACKDCVALKIAPGVDTGGEISCYLAHQVLCGASDSFFVFSQNNVLRMRDFYPEELCEVCLMIILANQVV